MTEPLSTGIDVLDRMLGGGVPAGSLVNLSAQPTSQAEMFIYELAKCRPTLYLSTVRSEPMVSGALDRADVPHGDISIREFDLPAPSDPEERPDAILREAMRSIEDISEGTNVVVDPINVLELTGAPYYQRFLNDLSNVIDESGSIALLHCLDGRSVPDQRDITEYMADIVFSLTTEVNEDSIETRLAVPKFRGKQALQETIKLNLSDEITVDMSRNIA